MGKFEDSLSCHWLIKKPNKINSFSDLFYWFCFFIALDTSMLRFDINQPIQIAEFIKSYLLKR